MISLNYLYLSLLAILCPLATALAQYDSLLHKPYAEKVEQIHRHLYKELLAPKDPVLMARKGEEIKRYAVKNKDRELELEVVLFLTYRFAFFTDLPKEEAIQKLNDLIDIATRENIWHIRVRTRRVLAEYYWKYVKNYELAFEQYFLLDKELSTLRVEDYPELPRDFMQIGESYYFFHDYPMAKKYFKKAIAIKETNFNAVLINSCRNTLGLCYQHEKQYDSSDYYFNQVVLTPFAKARADWERIAKGNLGANHYYRKEYDQAIPLLEYDYNGAVKIDDYGPAAGATILLADIYLSRGDFQKSWTYITKAQENIKKAEQEERLRFLYPIISNWYSLKGNGKLAQSYHDSTLMAFNDYHEKYNALKVLRAQQKINLQEEALRKAEFTIEQRKKTNQRNLLIGIVAGLCVFILLGYFIQKKRQLAKDLKIQAATQELEIATLNLNRFTESISEKNKLIEQLQNRREDGEKSDLLYQLQQSTILTEEDWQSFQHLFDKVYPGFRTRTRQTYPDLSVSEIRYFHLSKLKLSSKEMAAMLGVSPNTVQVLKHRIRKKLNFPDTTSMEEAINRI